MAGAPVLLLFRLGVSERLPENLVLTGAPSAAAAAAVVTRTDIATPIKAAATVKGTPPPTAMSRCTASPQDGHGRHGAGGHGVGFPPPTTRGCASNYSAAGLRGAPLGSDEAPAATPAAAPADPSGASPAAAPGMKGVAGHLRLRPQRRAAPCRPPPPPTTRGGGAGCHTVQQQKEQAECGTFQDSASPPTLARRRSYRDATVLYPSSGGAPTRRRRSVHRRP